MAVPKKKYGKQFLIIVSLTSVLAVTLASLTYYVASTPVSHMSIVPQDTALSSIRYYHNASQVFASGSTQWLLVSQLNILGAQSEYYASFYMFKIAGGDGRDFAVIGIDPTFNGTSVVDAQVVGVYYYVNNTVVTVRFHIGTPGTYIIDFGLKLRVYSTLLFLPVAQEDIRVATDLRVRIGS